MALQDNWIRPGTDVTGFAQGVGGLPGSEWTGRRPSTPSSVDVSAEWARHHEDCHARSPIPGLLSLSPFHAAIAPAAAADGPFRDLALDSIQNLPARGGSWEIPLPRHFRALEVDVKALATLLDRAPAERSAAAAVSPLVIALPYPDGTDRLFRVEESPILEPALAAKFPEIHTYVAQGIDDPTATARLSLTSLGFHAMVLSAAGTVFIDPYRKWDARYALSYFKDDAVRAAGAPFHCDVKGESPVDRM